MLIEQYEIVKESIFLFENLEEKIIGRILKNHKRCDCCLSIFAIAYD